MRIYARMYRQEARLLVKDDDGLVMKLFPSHHGFQPKRCIKEEPSKIEQGVSALHPTSDLSWIPCVCFRQELRLQHHACCVRR